MEFERKENKNKNKTLQGRLKKEGQFQDRRKAQRWK